MAEKNSTSVCQYGPEDQKKPKNTLIAALVAEIVPPHPLPFTLPSSHKLRAGASPGSGGVLMVRNICNYFLATALGTCALCVSERRVCMAASLVAESSEPLLQCKVCSPLAANSFAATKSSRTEACGGSAGGAAMCHFYRRFAGETRMRTCVMMMCHGWHATHVPGCACVAVVCVCR